MASSSTPAAALLPIALVLGSCRTPTQITVEVFTDLPCTSSSSLPRTILRIGALASIDTKPPTVDATRCTNGRVGSLVIVPSGDPNEEVALEVVTKVGGGDPGDCRESGVFDGCIAARRALHFVPHSELELPIDLDLDCAGVKCDPTETCVKGGCISAEIVDSSACHGDTCRLGKPAQPGPDAGDTDAPGALEWARAIGPTALIPTGIAAMADGSFVVAGSFGGDVVFDRKLSSKGKSDVALLHLSRDGRPLWSRQLGGDDDELATELFVLPGDDVLVVGDTESGSFQAEGGAALPSPGHGGLLLARYRSDGTHVWSRRYPGGEGYYAAFGGAAIDAAGDLVLAEIVYSMPIDWDGTPHDGAGDTDVALVRVSVADGTVKAIVMLPTTAGSNLWPSSLAMSPAGPVLVGSFDKDLDTLPTAAAGDGFVIALDDAFAPRWSRSTVDTTASPGSQTISAVAVAGTHTFVFGAQRADSRIGGVDLTNSGAFALELDASGAVVRSKVYPEALVIPSATGVESTMSAAPRPGGGMIVWASARGAPGDPCTFGAGLAGLTLGGSNDLLLVELDATLAPVRQRLFGDAADQFASHVLVDPAGYVLVSGIYDGAVDLGVLPALPGGGSGTSFVARLAQ